MSKYNLTPEDQRAIVETAARLGIKPGHLVSVIGYETAGSFDPWQRGPTTRWGTHRGLIQFGEPQRRQYGVYKGQSFADQVRGPVFKYLSENGVRPGHSLAHIYSIVNAGSLTPAGEPRWDASDGKSKTVRSHVKEIERTYLPRADKLLGPDLAGYWRDVAPQPPAPPTTLKSGRGSISTPDSAVAEWQQFLTSRGYDVGKIDGSFGRRTDAATRQFQRDNGLTGDGKVGPLTRQVAAALPPLEQKQLPLTAGGKPWNPNALVPPAPVLLPSPDLMPPGAPTMLVERGAMPALPGPPLPAMPPGPSAEFQQLGNQALANYPPPLPNMRPEGGPPQPSQELMAMGSPAMPPMPFAEGMGVPPAPQPPLGTSPSMQLGAMAPPAMPGMPFSAGMGVPPVPVGLPMPQMRPPQAVPSMPFAEGMGVPPASPSLPQAMLSPEERAARYGDPLRPRDFMVEGEEPQRSSQGTIGRFSLPDILPAPGAATGVDYLPPVPQVAQSLQHPISRPRENWLKEISGFGLNPPAPPQPIDLSTARGTATGVPPVPTIDPDSPARYINWDEATTSSSAYLPPPFSDRAAMLGPGGLYPLPPQPAAAREWGGSRYGEAGPPMAPNAGPAGLSPVTPVSLTRGVTLPPVPNARVMYNPLPIADQSIRFSRPVVPDTNTVMGPPALGTRTPTQSAGAAPRYDPLSSIRAPASSGGDSWFYSSLISPAVDSFRGGGGGGPAPAYASPPKPTSPYVSYTPFTPVNYAQPPAPPAPPPNAYPASAPIGTGLIGPEFFGQRAAPAPTMFGAGLSFPSGVGLAPPEAPSPGIVSVPALPPPPPPEAVAMAPVVPAPVRVPRPQPKPVAPPPKRSMDDFMSRLASIFGSGQKTLGFKPTGGGFNPVSGTPYFTGSSSSGMSMGGYTTPSGSSWSWPQTGAFTSPGGHYWQPGTISGQNPVFSR